MKKVSKNIEKCIVNLLENCINCKQFTQICLIQLMNSEDVNKTIKCIHTCMEVTEVCNICIYFITSNSPCTMSCLRFAKDVLKNAIKESEKLKVHNIYGDIEMQYSGACANFIKDIDNFKKEMNK